MTDEQPHPVEQRDAQTAVVRELFDSLPGGAWNSCVVNYRKAGRVAESQVNLTANDGATVVVTSPLSMITALKRLRELMATEGQGAWLSVTIEATPDGQCSFDFNYDARPDWTVQPTDETYVVDLRNYPRRADSIPDWYPCGN